MKKVIIYPGRFQPMLSHHAQVFDQLNALYNDAEVYIATSDKVEPGIRKTQPEWAKYHALQIRPKGKDKDGKAKITHQ